MTVVLSSPWRDLTFMSPLSEERAARLVSFLTEDLYGAVLDLGCGWAELLLRVVAAAPRSSGLGIDRDPTAIAHAAQLAADRTLSQRVTLLAADATSALPDRAAAVISVGATHVWAPRAGEAAEPLHYDVALSRIRDLVPRGTRIVYADGIWSRPPTSQATEPLGGRADEFVSLAELVTLAVNAGFAIYATHEATTDEWDHFESGYSACYARWLAEHSDDHPEAAEVRGLAERQREGYLAGYRNVLGFAYLHLVAV